jgi:3-phytase
MVAEMSRTTPLGVVAVMAALMMLSACTSPRPLPEVAAVAQTRPVPSSDDAADDPAIWVNAQAPEQSRILGTNKRSGLHVYDLQGRELQELPVGRVNNVDLRQDVPWGDGTVDLAVATNRTDQTLSLFVIDDSGEVAFLEDSSVATGLPEPYGVCLHLDRRSDALHVIANDKNGQFRQWRLAPGNTRTVEATLVREFAVSSQPEGCVVDDDTGVLYLGEETVGVWRASADPEDAFQPVPVDTVTGPNLVADVEGMSLYRKDGRTLLLVSSQGDHSYAVYDTEGDRYLGAFRIGEGDHSGAFETDGIDSSERVITPAYPAGLLVVQDGKNWPDNQNFKFISMADVLALLALPEG